MHNFKKLAALFTCCSVILFSFGAIRQAASTATLAESTTAYDLSKRPLAELRSRFIRFCQMMSCEMPNDCIHTVQFQGIACIGGTSLDRHCNHSDELLQENNFFNRQVSIKTQTGDCLKLKLWNVLFSDTLSNLLLDMYSKNFEICDSFTIEMPYFAIKSHSTLSNLFTLNLLIDSLEIDYLGIDIYFVLEFFQTLIQSDMFVNQTNAVNRFGRFFHVKCFLDRNKDFIGSKFIDTEGGISHSEFFKKYPQLGFILAEILDWCLKLDLSEYQFNKNTFLKILPFIVLNGDLFELKVCEECLPEPFMLRGETTPTYNFHNCGFARKEILMSATLPYSIVVLSRCL